MKNNLSNKPVWLVALWNILPVVIAIVLTVFISVAIVGFKFSLLLDVFEVYWLAFIIIIVFVYGFTFVIIRYPVGTPTVCLLALAFIFMLASFQRHDISEQLRLAIQEIVDVNYLVSAITIVAFVLAFVTISKKKA